MKKTALATLAILTLALGATACSSGGTAAPAASSPAATAPASSAASASSAAASPATLVTKAGKITVTDRRANIEKGSGAAITITPGASGQARFQLIDPTSGGNYADFYVFNYATNTFLRHHKSVAMGKTYEYTVDLRTKKLLSVKDATGKDLSASTKKMNRWDSAEQENVGFMETAETYFQKTYGKSIQDATTKA